MSAVADQILGKLSMPGDLQVLTLRRLLEVQREKVEWLVDGLIPRGTLSLLAGRPKAGKSLLAIDLLASVALAQPFLGRETNGGNAVYVPAEDALPLVAQRLYARLDGDIDAPLYTIPADGSLDQSVRIDDPLHLATFGSVLREWDPSLLVLDPFRELHDQPENEADAMARLLRPLRSMAHNLGWAIVLIHHRNKYATDSSVAVRGSSAITGGVDVTITLDVAGDADLRAGQIVTARVEGRYAPRQHIAARLGEGLRWQPLDPATLQRPDARSQILSYLQTVDQPASTSHIARELGLAGRTVANTLVGLQRADQVTRSGQGSRYDPFVYRLNADHTDR